MLAAEEAGLGIVVVNYQSHHLLETNLQGLAEEIPNANIVVVDSLSTMSERETLRVMCAARQWVLVEPDCNVGFGGGMNLGVAEARKHGAKVFLLLNPDAIMTRHSVEALHDAVIREPMMLCAPVILKVDGGVWFDGAVVDRRAGRIVATRKFSPTRWGHWPWLTGACLMLSDQLWDAVEGFDQRYFLYWEDVDLSVRVQEEGGTLRVLPTATAVHDEGLTHRASNQTPGAKSDLYYYFNIRNRLLFGGSHLGAMQYVWWILMSPTSAVEILLRGGRRQFIRPLGPVRAAVRGIIDGLVVGGRARRSKGTPK